MGVPKFFRWLSERYPLINQPIHCPPSEETKERHGFPSSGIKKGDKTPDTPMSAKRDARMNTNLPHIMPEFDRLYLDMNGIIHCSSHNNAEEEIEKPTNGETNGNGALNADSNPPVNQPTTRGPPPITEEQIFQNVCYYLDRIITDIVQPKELVFLAIDGVAPRAKLNQQRGRRYRSGSEREIEMHLMTLQRAQQQDAGISRLEGVVEADGGGDTGFWWEDMDHNVVSGKPDATAPRGAQRFSGTIEAVPTVKTDADAANSDENEEYAFHSNAITPGTPFLHRCSKRIIEFIRDKLENDPKWHDLTIVFSGHDVPGEGEHKIMEFMRHQKHKPDYNPNTRHCIYGQDGDLIMLGLATHEPHCCLLREEVVFDLARRKALESMAKLEHEEVSLGVDSDGNQLPPLSAAIQSYIHSSRFELLHFSVLRDYLALEFETFEVNPSSKFKLEPTIDDFVFMTFFVGNDFLPHMPALDIGDEAFDLLFYAYKRNRGKWLSDDLYLRAKPLAESTTMQHPYLTDAGKITSGNRVEAFLRDVGSYEDVYHDNKRFTSVEDNERIRKADAKAGRESHLPSQEVLDQVEQSSREMYLDMLIRAENEGEDNKDDDDRASFQPVTSTRIPQISAGVDQEGEAPLRKKIGGLLRESLSGDTKGASATISSNASLVDLKGRYYYDKFGFSPFDAEKHLALRKAYIEGLVWNLEYYYKGVVSWEWYYPYNYGPMLSDLVNINATLESISFFGGEESSSSVNDGKRKVAGEPLRPFEQLLGCLPPSSSNLLPKPMRWLMTDKSSPLIEFYPESFAVDMNGKRWPWEAVTLLPFIDSKKLIHASRTLIDESLLSEEEKALNKFGNAHIFTRDGGTINAEPMEQGQWKSIDKDADVAFLPQVSPGTVLPSPCFPTLMEAPIRRLNRRKININVFGLRSRYRTALLEIDELPPLPPAHLMAKSFIGTTVYFRYPFLQEGFVCAVSDSNATYRGGERPKKFTGEGREKRRLDVAKMYKHGEAGAGMVGTGGVMLPPTDITLSLRPLAGVETLPDGSRVKVFAKFEVEVPFFSAIFSPSARDPRLDGLSAKLEKNPYSFDAIESSAKGSTSPENSVGNNNIASGFYSNAIQPTKLTAAPVTRSFSTLPTLQHNAAALVRGNTFRATQTVIRAQRGDPRRRFISTASAVAFFFFANCVTAISAAGILQRQNGIVRKSIHQKSFAVLNLESIRGGDVEQSDVFDIFPKPTPPIEFAHGTTTLSFVFKGGIVAAVDSRASIGNFVGSKTTQKVLPVSSTILGTMAGGAADCSFWIRFLRSEAKTHELVHDGRGISVARASRILSNCLYQNRGLDLSVGTMIMGYHPRDGFDIYYCDNTGVRIKGDMFSVGSGSTFALGILDTERRFDMTEEEAVALGIKAIRHATLRDSMSGGYIGVYLITKDGWRKVFSEDLASRA